MTTKKKYHEKKYQKNQQQEQTGAAKPRAMAQVMVDNLEAGPYSGSGVDYLLYLPGSDHRP